MTLLLPSPCREKMKKTNRSLTLWTPADLHRLFHNPAICTPRDRIGDAPYLGLAAFPLSLLQTNLLYLASLAPPPLLRNKNITCGSRTISFVIRQRTRCVTQWKLEIYLRRGYNEAKNCHINYSRICVLNNKMEFWYRLALAVLITEQ